MERKRMDPKTRPRRQPDMYALMVSLAFPILGTLLLVIGVVDSDHNIYVKILSVLLAIGAGGLMIGVVVIIQALIHRIWVVFLPLLGLLVAGIAVAMLIGLVDQSGMIPVRSFL